MRVYVCFRYYPYEGCTEPEKIFDTKEKAEAWVKEDAMYREFKEMEIE